MSLKHCMHTAVIALAVATSSGGLLAQEYTSSSFRPSPVSQPEGTSVRFMDHRSTELGDALDGLSLVIEAQGRFERNRSEALINLQQAERLRLQNLIEREQAKVAVQKQRLELQALKAERIRLVRQLSLESQARMRPAVVISQKGSIQWIEPLRAPQFAAHRESMQSLVGKLAAARSSDERQALLDEINFECQELIETLKAHKQTLSPSAIDSCCRFAIRLYDDLQSPSTTPLGSLTLR